LKYPHKIKTNQEVPDAIEVYRKVLASQRDHSVTIITTGFLTNLYALLISPADKYSKLNGRSLVAKKVRHLVCMAGKFPSGSEFNVDRDPIASQFVFENWPTPVLLSGFEIGMKIKTGLPIIHNESIRNSPVKDVFRISIPMSAEDSAGRKSWDETAVLVAVLGYKPWYQVDTGKMIVAADGSDTWSSQPSVHSHLVEQQSPEIVQRLINTLMMHQPRKK
jgi:inosine-uridine nucleoside N-ribohydrolase